MAINHNFTTADNIFRSEKKFLDYEIFDADDVTPLDVSTWTLAWVLKHNVTSASALLQKSTTSGISITGVFNADPQQNTQRVRVTIAKSDWENLDPGDYHHSLTRTDEGQESQLSYGTLPLQAAE